MAEHNNRVLTEKDPEQVATELKNHMHLARGERLPMLMWDAVFGLHELADLRAKLKALKPYIDHKLECAKVPAVIGHGGKVQHKAKRCNCGLARVQTKRRYSCRKSL